MISISKNDQNPAYSEIVTPVQWLVVPLFGFFTIWTTLPPTGDTTITVPILGYLSIRQSNLLPLTMLVLFTYFADDAHDLAEGIHDVEGDRKSGVMTYATSFGEKTAAVISFGMLFISGLLGILLYYTTILSLMFLIPFLVIWIYTLWYSYKLILSDETQQKYMGKIVGRKEFNYLLFSYVLIFLDVFLQLVNFYYLRH